MRTRSLSRGFTLIELLVTLVISSVAMTAISSALIMQVQYYRAQANRRASQSNARQALSFIQSQLRAAGYGVDPDRAILAFDSFDAASPLAQAANYPDALVMHARDPAFQRIVTAADAGQLTFTPALQEPLRQGQILLVMCSGAISYAFVTVAATTDADATRVTLEPAAAGAESPVSSPGARFHQQGNIPADGCYNDALKPAALVKVDRKAFYVAALDDDASAATPAVPYLMMHDGTDLNADEEVTAADAVPIADNVEQLQIAYVLNTVTDAAPQVVGVTDMVPWGDDWDANAPPPKPLMRDSYKSPSRLTNHPANIRQVRVTLVSRGTLTDEGTGDDLTVAVEGSYDGNVIWKQLENLGASPAPFNPAGGGYARTVLRGSVAPKNLMMRGQFLPPNGLSGG